MNANTDVDLEKYKNRILGAMLVAQEHARKEFVELLRNDLADLVREVLQNPDWEDES